MCWQVCLSQGLSSLLLSLGLVTKNCGTTKPVCPGFLQGCLPVLRVLGLGSLCSFPQAWFFISLKNNVKEVKFRDKSLSFNQCVKEERVTFYYLHY